jgi:hypothetical protein
MGSPPGLDIEEDPEAEAGRIEVVEIRVLLNCLKPEVAEDEEEPGSSRWI